MSGGPNSGISGLSQGISRLLTFIRFSHTLFALPFALGALFVASDGFPPLLLLLWVVLAMVFARTAAMTFNRLADWEIDKINPRTEGRHRLLSKSSAILLLVASSLLFVFVCSRINILCLLLSPVALVILFFYSLTKRFTHFSHFFLGLALALSPSAAWIAATSSVSWPPLILSAAVLFWVAGFDLVYATQDIDHDRKAGLHNLAAHLGPTAAARLSAWLHLVAFIGFVLFGLVAELAWPYTLALICMAVSLGYEHRLVGRLTSTSRPLDTGLLNQAFFSTNAIVGLFFALGSMAAVLI
jgi:4-hydroxybenzoate polyprenyltransferase